MRDYAKVIPTFWTGATGKAIREQGRDPQVLALYLLTSPHANMLGLYYLPLPLIAHETGIPLQGARKGLRRLSEAHFAAYDEESEVVWVYEMARYQVGDRMSEKDNRVIGIRKEYAALPKNPFLKDFFEKYRDVFHLDVCRDPASPSEAPRKPLGSQEQEQEQYQETTELRSRAAEQPDPTTLDGGINGRRQLTEAATRVLSFLNEKAGRDYKPVPANLRLIAARIKETDEKTVRKVTSIKCYEWRNDPKMDAFLRPKTLYNATNFANYAGEIRKDALKTES